MRIAILQNNSDDGPAYLGTWLARRGVDFDVFNFDAGESPPTTLAPTTDRNLQTRGNASFLTMKPADFRVDPRHVQLLDNDTIVASGVLSFTANVGAARPVLKTRYTHVYQRQPDGKFKIVHEHMSSPPPGTGTP